MDFISYRGLPMRIIQTVNCEREHILDDSDTTYKWTRWRGTVVATYGPGAITFQAQGFPPWGINAPNTGAGGPPTTNGGVATGGGIGSLPALTDAAIREFLSQPRGQLILQSLGNLVLVSPRTFAGQPLPCDANNGPFIRVNSIVEVAGERMWRIELSFDTCIVENPTPSMIVNNRWVAQADVNWQHLTTRDYVGTVNVRSDALNSLFAGVSGPTLPNGIVLPNPNGQLDALRQAFCAFSVPPNFQREAVHIQVTPDGLTAHYRVRDVEQLWNKGANCPAVRLEVQESSWAWEGRMARFILSGFNAGFLPKYYRRVHVRAWGNAITLRTTLLNMALAIATSRVGTRVIFDPTLDELVTSQDLHNSVDVVLTRSWDIGTLGIFGAAAATAISLFTNGTLNNGQQQIVAGDQQSPNIAANGPLLPTPINQQLSGPGSNPAFPNAGGTRGTWLGNLLAQVLEPFHGQPGAPP